MVLQLILSGLSRMVQLAGVSPMSEPHWVRVLRCLKDFNPEQHEYVAPFSLTQDGIAEAVGISRAHCSLVLKDLVQRELVEDRLVYVVGGKRRRKVYVVTGRGWYAL